MTTRFPSAAPPAGLADGDTGPMNRPSTPSCRSGRQLSEPLRISADSCEQETVSIVLGVAATAIPCGRKAAAPTTTVTAAGRQILCPNMSGGPPDDRCARASDNARPRQRWCWSLARIGRPKQGAGRPLKLGVEGRPVTPRAACARACRPRSVADGGDGWLCTLANVAQGVLAPRRFRRRDRSGSRACGLSGRRRAPRRGHRLGGHRRLTGAGSGAGRSPARAHARSRARHRAARRAPRGRTPAVTRPAPPRARPRGRPR